MRRFLASLASLFILASIASAQSITVTSPNGGETWAGCTQHNITWTASGVSNFYSIDYSLDNGASWTSVASFYNTTSGSFPWTVPNVTSTTVKVRVMDSNDTLTVDQSDNYFTISGGLTVTSPNGGETWTGLTTQTITWAASGTSNYYNIEYSTNAGNTWTSIVTNSYITSGAYNWSVPNVPTTTALIRITDAQNTCLQDASNNTFTINQAQPILLTPNGGENWFAGTNNNITWTAGTFTTSFVDIEYSTNNGSTWNTVVLSTNNDGSHTWLVPNTPSTICLVRVKETGNGSINDVSNSTFTIAPHVTVTSPNGGEAWVGCAVQNITWTAGGTSTQYKIEYSTDGGSTWTTIDGNYTTGATNASYSWTVPNITSTQTLVAVTDVFNSSKADTSNGFFAISPSTNVLVGSPNGGNTLKIGEVQTINYAVSGPTTNVKLEYSTNGGSTWITITNSTSGGQYNWTIPNTPSTNALIKATDASNSCSYDISDSVFTILDHITVTSPNGFETLSGCGSHTITWTNGGTSGAYKISYSSDNGSTWNVIASSYSTSSNQASYNWSVVPNIASSQALIKIEDANNPGTYNDVSDNNFTLSSTINIVVLSPNGGENWQGVASPPVGTGSGSYNMSNSSVTNCGSNFYDTGGPSSSYYSNQNFTKTFYPNTAGNKLEFTFTQFSTESCCDRLYIYNGPSTASPLIGQYSGSNNPGTVTSTHSTGALTFRFTSDYSVNYSGWAASFQCVAGSTPNENITWAATGTSNVFDIDYTTNNGTNWISVADNYSTTSYIYPWAVPNTPSSQALVRVTDANNSCKTDQSNSTFTINAADLELLDPNGGETWYAGTTHTIEWNEYSVLTNDVVLEYSTDNGTSWNSIAASTPNDGIHTWLVPNTPSTQCLVRISEFGNLTQNDVSDAVFTIAPHITVTAPNGGETLTGCDSYSITWNQGGTSNVFDIDYSTNGGATWQSIVANYNTAATSASYNWAQLPNISSANGLIAITDANNAAKTDTSNAVFNFAQTSEVVLLSPNGGEAWQVGSVQAITYSTSGSTSNVRIDYSTDNGATWNVVTTSTSGGTFSWTIPNTPSTNCLVKVENSSNNCKFDISDTLFTIVPGTPVFTVTSPNGGESLFPTNTHTITWTSQYVVGANVQIEYSTNNGGSWIMINPLTPNDGSYSWIIPNNPSASCLVKVSEAGNTSVNDSSNAVFTINPHVTVTAPNGGESWAGCSQHNITWTAGGTSTQYRLEYSSDGGSTWNIIESNHTTTATNATYNWTMPNISSTQMLVAVVDIFNSTKSDTSDAVFTLNNTANVVLTTPNGGEVWKIGTQQNINYTVSGGVSNVKLEYSTNNGVTWITIINSTNGGQYTWTIPNNASNIARVRVSDATNSCNFDISDTIFTILDHITITSPNGYENLSGCGSHTITWTNGGTSGSYDIEYSSDGGSTWNAIVNNYSTASNNASYSWSVIPNVGTFQGLLRVVDANNASMADSSDNVFAVTATVNIVVLSPNGGENWTGVAAPAVGTGSGSYNMSNSTVTNCGSNFYDTGGPSSSYYSNQNFTKTFYPNTADNKLQFTFTSFSTESCCDRLYIYNGPNTSSPLIGQYSGSNNPGTVISTHSTGALTFRFTSDYSVNYSGWAANFECVSSAQPNENIVWAATGTSNVFDIDYTTDNGSTWNVVEDNYPSTSYVYPWVVPNTPTATAKVRVTDANNACKFDTSNATFTINAADLELEDPNGGETWYAGTTHNILWNDLSVLSANVVLEYSTNNGTSWITIAASTPNDGTHSWTVPNTPSTQCLVRLSEFGNAAQFDVSDAVFTIAPHITVTAPNGGQTLTGCNSYTITWSQGGTSNLFDIDYSTDGGSTWVSIASAYNTSATNASYSWSQIPNLSSSQGLIRVSDAGNPSKVDSSDAVFNFAQTSEVVLITPDGGEVWQVGSNHSIDYQTSGGTSNVKIMYSTNSGTNWNNIVTSTNGGNYSWTIPNTPSTTCLVRVENSTNSCKFDESDSLFTITPGTPTFTLTSPNGGEGWFPTTTHNITWTSQYVVGANVALEYSTDNGNSWQMIIPFTPNDGSHPWIVPNIPSDQMLIRISETGNSSVMDVSNAVWSILPHVQVTSPNGGETWAGCAVQNITWVGGGTSTQYKIEYSTDGGSTWSQIVANYTDTDSAASYSWTVPNISSNQFKVRVSDLFSPAKVDASDANFTVNQATNAIVVSPNGGETWKIGTTQQINYSTTGGTNNVKIEYSTNNGSTWNTITNSTSGGSYNWSVPNTPSTLALIRIEDVNNACNWDQSDAVFTIDDHITIITPNGGESVVGCESFTINWIAGGTTGFYDLEYSTDNGTTWNTIVANHFTNSTTPSYTWSPLPSVNTTNARVRITDANNASYSDTTDAVFTMAESSHIIVLSPNGGEFWQGQAAPPVGTGSGTYYMSNSTVTNCGSSFYDTGGPSGSYYTNQNFTKTFYPNTAGNKLQFTFSAFSTESCCDRLYIYNGPSTSSPLIGQYSGSNNPGTVTSSHSTGALTFRFTSDYSVNYSGWAATFSCVSGAVPNENIVWAATNTSNEFDIDYTTDGGTSWINIVDDYNTTNYIYPWAVPNTPSNTCKVRVTDSNNGCKNDDSNSNFTIIQAPHELVEPNGGEVWYSGQNQLIEWNDQSYLSNDVVIEYSLDSGATWNIITLSTPNDGSYTWTIPFTQVPHFNCLVRVSEYNNTFANDVSDQVFAIRPNIRIISPNGDNNQQQWGACTQSSITWEAGTSNNYLIELSTDSGMTWTTVQSNYSNNSANVTYNWSIPNTPSTKCLVRVTDVNNTSKTDVSDSTFTISPAITLVYPNIGGSVVVGDTVNITWIKNGTSNYYDIDYSTNGGTSWNNIVFNHFDTTSSYAWAVPNTPSTNCLVRVRDNTANCKADQSEIPFTITTTAPAITVTSPNGGESWAGCTQQNITWNDTTTTGSFNIAYSTDGGVNWTQIINNYTTATGSYAWTVPNITTTNAVVRVTDAGNASKWDISNLTFSLTQSVTAIVTANGPTEVCQGDSVELTSNSATGNVWSNGATSQTIFATTSGNYSVTVTNAGCAATSNQVPVTVNALPNTPVITPNGPTSFCTGGSVVLTSSAVTGNTWFPGLQTTQAINVTTSGTFQVAVVDANGCSASSTTTTVTVSSPPSAPTAASNSPVSQGASINLTASTISGATYYWTGPNGYTSTSQNPSISGASASDAGIYSVVAVVGGCTSNVSTTTVTVTQGGGTSTITGLVKTEINQPIRTVTVDLAGASTDTYLTSPGVGTYSLTGVTGGAHTVVANKSNDTITNNGVTTFDLILMQRHILTTDTLATAYKVIAADVDRGGSVTTLDIILTRRVILQQVPTFPKGRLWVFVPASQTYGTWYQPWPFDTSMTIASLSNQSNVDWIGCHLGDVNNSYNPNTAKTIQYARDIMFELPSMRAESGDVITVPVRVKDFNDVSGFQFSMNWNAQELEFINAADGVLDIHEGANQVSNGKLAIVWTKDDAEGLTLDDGTEVFYLNFRVKGSNGIASPVSITGSKIPMEAVSGDLEYLRIRTTNGEIEIGDMPSAGGHNTGGYALHQNFPNPFDDQTEIRFEVPERSQVEFVIRNVAGTEVMRITGSYDAGSHSIVWDGKNQSGVQMTAGVYFVQMRAKDYIGTVKMVYTR